MSQDDDIIYQILKKNIKIKTKITPLTIYHTEDERIMRSLACTFLWMKTLYKSLWKTGSFPLMSFSFAAMKAWGGTIILW